MNVLKRMLLVSMCVLLLCTGVACQKQPEFQGGPNDPIVQTVIGQLDQIKEFESEALLSMNVVINDLAANLSSIYALALNEDPQQFKINANAAISVILQDKVDTQENVTSMYYMWDETDPSLYYQLAGSWYKVPLTKEDWEARTYENNVMYELKDILSVEDAAFTNVGTETAEGITAIRLEGMVPPRAIEAKIDQAVEATGMLEEGLLADLDIVTERAKVIVWIDQETNNPIQYEIDMTDILRQIMKNELKGDADAIDVESVFVQTVLTNLNAVDPIELPEEAASAMELDPVNENEITENSIVVDEITVPERQDTTATE